MLRQIQCFSGTNPDRVHYTCRADQVFKLSLVHWSNSLTHGFSRDLAFTIVMCINIYRELIHICVLKKRQNHKTIHVVIL